MDIRVGQVENVNRVFDQTDFDRFAALSGDDNPIHVDPAFSARTTFGRTVAHGMLLYGVVCGALGTRHPGAGTVQLEQELVFPSPTYAGEEVTVRLEVTALRPDEGLADLTTAVVRPGGEVGLQGRTRVRLPTETWGPMAPSTGDKIDHPTGSPFKGLEIGQRAETHRAFTIQDLEEYADLTGDANPIFTVTRYAQNMGLRGPMVPGPLLGGLFSYLLGTQCPGRGTNYLKQRLVFPAPAYPGEEITASVEVVRLRSENELVNLRTVCTNPAGSVVCRGEALVLVRDIQAR